jgi:hypothetical protein
MKVVGIGSIGLVIAIMLARPLHMNLVGASLIMGDFTERITTWSTLHNPFFAGPRADLLAMFPFVSLVVLLHLVGREAVLRPKIPS